MFSETVDDVEAARSLCASCPLVVRCAVVAFRRREREGVWGGFTAPEREEIVRAVRRRVRAS